MAKTVKVRVRVAVAVGSNGEWVASGGESDESEMSFCMSGVSIGDSKAIETYFLEADLPLPSPPRAVKARVKEGR